MVKLSEIEGIGGAYSTKLEKVGGYYPGGPSEKMLREEGSEGNSG